MRFTLVALISVLIGLGGSVFAQAVVFAPEATPVPDQGAGVAAVVKTISRGTGVPKPYAIVGDYLYVVVTGPSLDIYSLVSMERVGSADLKAAPMRLVPYSLSLWDNYYGSADAKPVFRLDAIASPAFDPFDVDAYSATSLKHLPSHLRPSGLSYALVYDGRVFANPVNGVVKAWRSGTVREYSYNTDLAAGACRIALAGETPVVFSTSAVFEVDANLCPTRRIVQVDAKEGPIAAVAGDGKTIAIATQQSLQVWSADGAKMLRQTRVRGIGYPGVWHQCLVPFAGGYLFSGKELAWIHPDAANGVWVSTPKGLKAPVAYAPYVAAVELTHHRILMTTTTGEIHVVDASKVLGRRVPPPTAEGGPRPASGALLAE